MMWIDIWIHHYTPNITFLDLNFGKLAKILEQGRGMNHAIMQWLKIDQLLRMNVTSTQGMYGGYHNSCDVDRHMGPLSHYHYHISWPDLERQLFDIILSWRGMNNAGRQLIKLCAQQQWMSHSCKA